MTRMLSSISLTGLLLVIIPASTMAAVAPSRLRVESERDRDVERVHRLLREEQVARRLATMGMQPGDIAARLERMSDAEVQRLAERLDDLAVGRDGTGLVIGLLVIAALVLLIIFLWERV